MGNRPPDQLLPFTANRSEPGESDANFRAKASTNDNLGRRCVPQAQICNHGNQLILGPAENTILINVLARANHLATTSRIERGMDRGMAREQRTIPGHGHPPPLLQAHD